MPVWSALTTQAPSPWSVTVVPDTVQIDDELDVEKVTVRPEVDEALTETEPVLRTWSPGPVKLIVWTSRFTVKLWEAIVAAA